MDDETRNTADPSRGRDALEWLVLLLAFWAVPTTLAVAAERDRVIEWQPPAGAVDGYRVHLGQQPTQYSEILDLGFVPPDPDGVGRATLQLDGDTEYYVSMTAYNGAGESGFSNEILIERSACDPTLCDDGNACTSDDCDVAGCRNDPLPDGTWCAQGSGGYASCQTGACQPAECLDDSHCDDGNVCNGLETCSASGCATGMALHCGAPSQCASPACDLLLGCVSIPSADGTPCDDGDKWTSNDHCEAGVCTGTRGAKPGKGYGRNKPK